MTTPLDSQDLDFTAIFALKAPAAAAPVDPAKLEADAQIGAASLKKGGYCITLTRRTAAPRTPAPPDARILVIEDEPSTAALLQRILSHAGYQPVLAANGREAAARLRVAPLPHLVLLDVILPDIEGFKILERIRQHEVIGDLPVVMLTAKAELADLMRGIAAGADGYVTKPASRGALESVMRQVLAGA